MHYFFLLYISSQYLKQYSILKLERQDITMKKLAIAITSLLLMTGCSSTPTITNTNNIKEHILKDNVAYDSFSSYSDSDTIIRLPNGEYIHGTKEVNGKYYDSDQDSGAIQTKKAKYYALLAKDVNNYLTEKFEGFNDSDEVFYNKKNGGFTNTSTVIDENGNETDLANNPDYESMTIKEVKEKEYNRLIQEDAKEEKKNLSSPVSELNSLLPKTDYISRTVFNKKNKYAIHYYEVEENEYFDYIKKIKEKGFDSIDPNSPEETFLGVNNDNILVNIHYDATNKTLDLDIRRQ